MGRNTLTYREKTRLIAHFKSNPGVKHQDLVCWALGEFGKSVGRSTVSRILATPPLSPSLNLDARRQRRPHYPEAEELLLDFFYLHEVTGVLSDYVLCEKVNELVHPSQVSMSWVQKFKRRYNISLRVAHGDAAPVDPDTLAAQHLRSSRLWTAMPADVFSFDETGLFYRMLPSQALVTKQIRGRKKDKTRITIGLGCNMTGTEKLDPPFIHTRKQPRCFRGVNVERIGIQYHANAKAWMTRSISTEWAHRFNLKMHGRRVLLLVDNASGHGALELSNVTIAFLPPNMTAYLQPLDAGIIKSFKCKYKKLLIRWVIDQLDADGVAGRADVLSAVKFTAEAWRGVTEETIRNCWCHTGIVPAPVEASLKATNAPRVEGELPALTALIKHLNLADPMDAARYIDIEDSAPEFYQVDETLETGGEVDSDEEGETASPFSHREALAACQQLAVYAFSQGSKYDQVDAIMGHAREMLVLAMKQQKPTALFGADTVE